MGAMNFARGHLELPVVIFWDLLHQGVNDTLLAVNRAGMWPTVLELLLGFSFALRAMGGPKILARPAGLLKARPGSRHVPVQPLSDLAWGAAV